MDVCDVRHELIEIYIETERDQDALSEYLTADVLSMKVIVEQIDYNILNLKDARRRVKKIARRQYDNNE
jgi:hypothetical protein